MKTQTTQTKYGTRILRMLFIFALALLPLFILLPLPVFAATITVDTLIDESDGSCSDGDCSLRDAIAVANETDTIDFGVTGIITLTLDYLTIDKDLTIEGPGAGDLIVSGDETYRVFWINEDVNATLSGITIADGKAQDGAGIFNQGGTLTLNNCHLIDNGYAKNGGAISNRSSGTLHVNNCVFSDNTAQNGGAIDNRATVHVSGSIFSGNSTSTWGGAIYNYSSTGIVTVADSTFSANGENTDYGGAICNQVGTLHVRDSIFSANNARVNGGAIYNEDDLTVANTDFNDNTAARGGGIHHASGPYGDSTSTVTGSDFFDNRGSAWGGGISNHSTMTVTHSAFYSNTTTGNGGGIFNGYALVVRASSFYSNTAQWGGGIENFDTLKVSESTFYSNVVTDTGGGICSHGALTVTNSTFYLNVAGVRGGGINNNEGSLHVTNATLVDNRASESGDGIRNEETATLINTIMDNSGVGGNCGGAALEAASTHGLATDGSCSPGFTQTTDVDLALNWEGWVFEVMTDSVAIDTGTNIGCPTVDQLGQLRPQDGDGDGIATCDVGAYEFSLMNEKIYIPLVMR